LDKSAKSAWEGFYLFGKEGVGRIGVVWERGLDSKGFFLGWIFGWAKKFFSSSRRIGIGSCEITPFSSLSVAHHRSYVSSISLE
jgi:hypothetical protein